MMDDFLNFIGAAAGWIMCLCAVTVLILMAVWPYLEAWMNRKKKP